MKKIYKSTILTLLLFIGGSVHSQGIQKENLKKKENIKNDLEVTVTKNANPKNFVRIINDHHAVIHTQILINAQLKKFGQ